MSKLPGHCMVCVNISHRATARVCCKTSHLPRALLLLLTMGVLLLLLGALLLGLLQEACSCGSPALRRSCKRSAP